MTIRIENIEKRFAGFQALTPLNLTIEQGEMVGLLGPSGSGKTTLLRIIAGLEVADGGRVYFADEDITDKPVRQRRVGFVFQNYALFNHMTVLQNVGFGLRMLPRKERPRKAEIKRKAQELLDMVQLGHLARRYPEQLSGGQRQRVALARALALEPEVLLLDEPFGALDAKVRQELRSWLKELHKKLGFTSVFVTHDQEEALELSDRVVVMSEGRIEQVDTPEELYAYPSNRFVFDFLGEQTVFKGRAERGYITNGDARITLSTAAEGNVELYFRSHEASLSAKPTSQVHLPVVVLDVSRIGAEVKVNLAPVGWNSEETWSLSISHEDAANLAINQGQALYVLPRQVHLFTENGSEPTFLRLTPALKAVETLAVC